jgi:SAM-dependent methyltransferase
MKQVDIVQKEFNEIWKNTPNDYDQFVKKMADPNYVVREPNHDNAIINMVHRAAASGKYILDNYPKGSSIVDAACGNGFFTCYMQEQGYDVLGFDFAETGIIDSKKIAEKIGVPTDIFHVGDHNYFKGMESESVDVICGLGWMRYLEESVRDFIYKETFRVLKPNGCFIVSNDNQLFDIFAMNNHTIDFWSDVIVSLSEVNNLLPSGNVKEALSNEIKLPTRKFSDRSVSKLITKHIENPLAFGKLVESYGYKLEKNVFPDCHLLPPFLEKQVDPDKLENLKGKISLQHAEGDWRTIFMGFEFVSFLKK